MIGRGSSDWHGHWLWSAINRGQIGSTFFGKRSLLCALCRKVPRESDLWPRFRGHRNRWSCVVRFARKILKRQKCGQTELASSADENWRRADISISITNCTGFNVCWRRWQPQPLKALQGNSKILSWRSAILERAQLWASVSRPSWRLANWSNHLCCARICSFPLTPEFGYDWSSRLNLLRYLWWLTIKTRKHKPHSVSNEIKSVVAFSLSQRSWFLLEVFCPAHF